MTEGLHGSSARFTPHGTRLVHAMQTRWRGRSRVLFSLIFSSVIYISQLRHVFNHLFLLVYWPPLHAEHPTIIISSVISSGLPEFLRVTWKDFPLYFPGLRSFIATVV